MHSMRTRKRGKPMSKGKDFFGSKGKNKAAKMKVVEIEGKPILVPKGKLKYGWAGKLDEFLNEKRRNKMKASDDS